VSLTAGANESPTPMVAVRSMGLGFESLIGQQAGERRQRLVTPDYLPMLMSIANDRFVENTKRIERFLTAFRHAMQAPAPRRNPDGEEWEDPAARRERKRAEGLKKKAQLQQEKASQADGTMDEGDLCLE
jgi:tRNA wybutosine-synthesizing protein 3